MREGVREGKWREVEKGVGGREGEGGRGKESEGEGCRTERGTR